MGSGLPDFHRSDTEHRSSSEWPAHRGHRCGDHGFPDGQGNAAAPGESESGKSLAKLHRLLFAGYVEDDAKADSELRPSLGAFRADAANGREHLLVQPRQALQRSAKYCHSECASGVQLSGRSRLPWRIGSAEPVEELRASRGHRVGPTR